MDAKEFRVFMWGIVKFSMNSCSRFVQKHPTVSGVLLILMVMYLFLPSVFYLLVYSSPVLVCTGVFIRFYLSTQRPQSQSSAKDEKRDGGRLHVKAKSLPAELTVNADGDSSIQAHRATDAETKGSDTKVVKEEAEMVSATNTRNDSIDIPAGVGEKTKGKEETSKFGGRHSYNVSVGDNIAALGGAASEPDLKTMAYSYEKGTKFRGGFSEVELESSDSDEDAPEGAKKPMEWTEDDQKNLMDLGFSEIERNRRLESLIAGRRAKKLFKAYTEKGMIDMDVAPPQFAHPLVARSNPFEFPNISDEQIPGSAPSVLLPNHNPFDLYDPLEEKPDHMKDSFQLEFTTTNQKEMLFCRHESLSLGSFFPPERLHELTGVPMFQRPSDKGDLDRKVEHSFQGGRTFSRNLSATDLVVDDKGITNQPQPNRESWSRRVETNVGKMKNVHDMETSLGNGIETQMKTDTLKHDKDEPISHSSLEDGESNFNANRRRISENQILQPTGFKFPELHNSPSHNSCPLPKARAITEPSYNSSLTVTDDIRSEDHSFYPHRGNWHTPNNSIASDMQVEVSEVGSPPLTADGTASSDDGESLTYDGDEEKEITSGSDEMWGLSPHAPKAEELERALREKRASHEDLRRRFTGNRKEPHGTRASSVMSLPPTNGPRRKDRAHSEGYDRTIPHSAGQVHEEGKEWDSNHVDATPTEISLKHMQLLMQPLEDSTPNATPEAHLERAQEQLNPFEKAASEVNITQDGKVVKSNEDRDGGISSTGSPENPAEELNINYNVDDHVLPIDDHREDLKRVADNEGNSENLNERVASRNIPSPVQSREGLISNSDSQELQTTSEVGDRMEIQTSNHTTTPNTQHELGDEQANAPSSSSSSLKSILPDRITVEQRLSSDSNYQMQNGISTSGVEEKTARNELTEAKSSQNLLLAECQSDVHEAKASITSTPTDYNTGASMKASDTPEQTKSNKNLLDDKEVEDPKLSKTLHDGSEPVTSDDAASKLSKPPEEINHGAVEHIEGIASMGHSDHGASIEQSKPKEEHDGVKVPDLIITKKESTDPPGKLSGAANINSNNIIDPKIAGEVNMDISRTTDGKDSATDEDPMESLRRQTDSASREIEDGNEPSGFSSKSSEENNDSSSNNNFEDFVNVIQHLHDHLIDVMTPGGAAATSEAAMTFRGAVEDSPEFEPIKPEDESDHIDVHNGDGGQVTPCLSAS